MGFKLSDCFLQSSFKHQDGRQLSSKKGNVLFVVDNVVNVSLICTQIRTNKNHLETEMQIKHTNQQFMVNKGRQSTVKIILLQTYGLGCLVAINSTHHTVFYDGFSLVQHTDIIGIRRYRPLGFSSLNICVFFYQFYRTERSMQWIDQPSSFQSHLQETI